MVASEVVGLRGHDGFERENDHHCSESDIIDLSAFASAMSCHRDVSMTPQVRDKARKPRRPRSETAYSYMRGRSHRPRYPNPAQNYSFCIRLQHREYWTRSRGYVYD